jgi:hypothetical protein
MTLSEIISRLGSLDDRSFIGVRKPWGPDSDAWVGSIPEDLRFPKEAANLGYSYFLEVSTALEILKVFGRRVPSPEEKVALMLFYAENDAYPSWVYSGAT